MLPQSQMCYLHNKRKPEGCASPFLEHFVFCRPPSKQNKKLLQS